MSTWKQSNYTPLDKYSLKIGIILIEIESNGNGQWSMECRALGINRVIRNPDVADVQLIAVQDVYDRLDLLSKSLPYFKQLAYPEAPLTHDEIKAKETKKALNKLMMRSDDEIHE